MFSMKKEREQEPPPPPPARCVVIQWNGSCLGPPTCHISTVPLKLSLKSFYIVSLILVESKEK